MSPLIILAFYHSQLAKTYEKENDWQKAQNELILAIQLEPRNVWYKRDLAFVYSRFQRWEAAKYLFGQMIFLAPNVSRFRQELADIEKLESLTP